MSLLSARWWPFEPGDKEQTGLLVAAGCGAVLVARIVVFFFPAVSFWIVLAGVIVLEIVAWCLLIRVAERVGEDVAKSQSQLRDRIDALTDDERRNQALRLLEDDTVFNRIAAVAGTEPLPAWVPDQIREILKTSESIEHLDGDVRISRASLSLLPEGAMRVASWETMEGDRFSLQMSPETGGASLCVFVDGTEIVVQEYPSVWYWLLVEAGWPPEPGDDF
jgi:hypothetical protein